MADKVLDQIFDELEHEEPECAECKRPMVSKRQWKAAGLEEREELRAEGYVPGGSNGLCAAHTLAERSNLNRPPGASGRPSRDWRPILEPRLAELDSGELTAADLARELNVNPKTIRIHVGRIRKGIENG